jgi:hypothetical protein
MSSQEDGSQNTKQEGFLWSLFPTDNGYIYFHLEKNSLEEIDPTLFIVKQSPSFFGKFRFFFFFPAKLTNTLSSTRSYF